MARSATERKQDQRERDKMTEDQRLARLLSRRISTDLFHSTDAALKRVMERAGIEEDQDMVTRLIHGADRLDAEQLNELTRIG